MILDMHYDSLDICLTAHFMRDSSFIKTQTLDFAQTECLEKSLMLEATPLTILFLKILQD